MLASATQPTASSTMFENSVLHSCRLLLARILSHIRLHRVEFVSDGNVPLVRKRRRWFADLVIPPGNLFLKMTASPSRVLSTRQWVQWEIAVHEATERNLFQPLLQSGCQTVALQFQLVPGVSLRQVLCCSEYSLDQKFDAILWSLIALRQLHELTADWGNGICQSISHGDATANNVIVDVENGTTCWIDFDTRHRLDLSEADRRADDLRTLIYSAAVDLPELSLPRLAEVLISAGFDDAVLDQLQLQLSNQLKGLSVAQLAQAPLSWSKATRLRSELLGLMDCVRSPNFRLSSRSIIQNAQ